MITDYKNSLVPRTVPEILSQAFLLYRDQFRVYIGVMIMVVLPLITFDVLVSQLQPPVSVGNSAALEYSLFTSLYLLVSLIIQSVFINGPITYITSEQNLGRMVSMGEAFTAIRGRLGRLAVTLIIFYTLLVGLFMLSSFTVACLIGFVGLAVAIYLSVAVNAFIAPVVVLENDSAIAAISRALWLAKSRFWTVAGLLLIAGLISIGIGVVVDVFLSGIGLSATTFGAFVTLLAQVTVAALAGPILPIAMTLMYYDTRIRLEQLDQKVLSSTKANFRPEDAPAPAPELKIERRDVMNVAMVMLGLFLLALLLAPLIANTLPAGF